MDNIFLEEWKTPHETVPFDKIRVEDYEPAIIHGMKADREQAETIATNPDSPTFANTLGVISQDNTLERATTVLFNQCSANTCDELENVAQKMAPLLADHANLLATDERMFERVRHIKEHEYDELTVEQQALTDKAYDGFIRHGIGLPPDKRARFMEIDRKVSQLTLQFAQNNLKAMNSYKMHLTREEDLAGLPETAIDAAADEARKAGLEGWLFTLHRPSMSPFMTYSERRELRKQMYMAHETISGAGSEWDNTETVRKIVNLRREFAQLLGYSNFADFVLEKRMAGDSKRVYRFINDLLEAYMPVAQREVHEVEEFARTLEGSDFKMQPWDFAYYSHKLKKERYDIDMEELRPYFELERVKEGVFGLATRLYGISFKKASDIVTYHKDVEAYDVSDIDGTFLAVLYVDFHPRKEKKNGAWMTNYKEQFVTPSGEDSRPHVSIVMNLTPPTENRPALLTLNEVETFLHEFGHALHGMFSKTRYQTLSGTNVAWDFVELPSQVMENFATEAEWLNTFARHYKTGDIIPEELIDKIVRSKNYLAGYSCVRQLSFCLLDMAYYTLEDEFTGSVRFFEEQAWRRAQVIQKPTGCCMSVQFEHIMSGGYSAGYYSYKWAEVLAADAFSAFKENDVLSVAIVRKFRNEILSKGGSENAMTLYKRFRGSEPTIDALLHKDGVK